jgi:hypothetical protein
MRARKEREVAMICVQQRTPWAAWAWRLAVGVAAGALLALLVRVAGGSRLSMVALLLVLPFALALLTGVAKTTTA